MLNLGPLGQLPGVNCYIILTLGFLISDTNEKAVTSVLESAAKDLARSYPWLEGQVVHDMSPNEEPNSGISKVVEYPPHQQSSGFVHAKDCRALLPSYVDIIKARAPLSNLDGNVVSPAQGFPYVYPTDVVQPVIMLQANFVKGGLLLTSCGHHKTMDANGHEQFLRQFARLCRGEKLLDEHVQLGNADQWTIFPTLKPGEESSSMEALRTKSTLNDEPGEWPPTGSGDSWKMFRFTAAKLASLKAEASRDVDSNSDVPYISSNDALTAFIFSRVTAVRSKKLPPISQARLHRAFNGRKRLDRPIGEGYMGHSIFCTSTQIPVANILEDSLSSVAIRLRQTVLGVNDHQFRSFVHLLLSEKDRSTINYGASYTPATDLLVTSFAAQQLYTTSFGNLLGLPDIIRRPRLPDGKGLCYELPKSREGDVDIIIGLEDEEYDGLQSDARWKKFAEVIE